MRIGLLAISIACCTLLGCNRSQESSAVGPKSPGRYAGIGVFDAGRLWGEMTGTASRSDSASAKLQDDEHIIVVLDSHTGEVRECGDHSGYCVSMNPGRGSPATLPVRLSKHAADLAAADRAVAH